MRVAAHHLQSLDVFRGTTIAAMILVNNPGDWSFVFPPLLHAYWTGCTFADVVFPWFIFIMGMAMPFAFDRRRQRGDATVDLYRRILTRVALLIVLGLLLTVVASWPAVLPLRLPGVLQRIALSYLVAAIVILQFDVRAWIIAIVSLLLGHWALLELMPFGGYPAGTLTPEHNLARYLDTIVFGRHALTIPNDPEGLLGTLPAAATALIGAATGHLMRAARDNGQRVRTLVLIGAAEILVGAAWSRVLPLSKPLWTGSFVLLVTGFAMLAFALAYVVIDIAGVRAWARPFLWLGVNPLAMYVLSEVAGHLLEQPLIRDASGRTTAKAWLFWRALQPWFGPRPAEWPSLVFGVGFVALWMTAAGVLYHRQIRIHL